jgi:serine/threonine-protein kinase
MALEIGSRLGHYDVTALIGEGGMGQVYQATDAKLNRQVALKILPEAFAGDPDRLARFQREAQVLASLNHPNIAAIHGLEDSEGTKALVLELVEGPTLADRIAQGPIPIDEALPIAKQIAEALDAAHEAGVIHRDLKPANIKVKEDGTVKVLDFGLAKAAQPVVGHVDGSDLTTITFNATATGQILGTPSYMGPEQARGQPVDRRADVWAFGCIVFEMLTGRRPFAGATTTDTLAAVVGQDPDWEALPASTPPRLVALLRRCLRKDCSRRQRTLGDVGLELEEVADALSSGEELARSSTLPRPSTRQVALPWAVAGLAIAAAVGVLTWSFLPGSLPPTVARLQISVAPASFVSMNTSAANIAVSRDGQWLAYGGGGGAGRDSELHLRHLTEREAQVVPGTVGAALPFFSPNGQWVGYFDFVEGQLKKVSVTGGTPITLCAAPAARGATWTDDGYIVFSSPSRAPLSRVSEDGGTPELLTELNAAAGETSHRQPSFVPGAGAVLFKAEGTTRADSEVWVQSLRTGERVPIAQDAEFPTYSPTGQVLYLQGGNLIAVPFDPDELELLGPATTVVDDAEGPIQHFALSEAGMLVYAAGEQRRIQRRLVWVDRQTGEAETLSTPARQYSHAHLSPDEARIVTAFEPQSVAIFEIATGVFEPLVVGRSASWPIWTPDGRRVTYASNQEGTAWDIFERPWDGSGAEKALLVGERLQSPKAWSPDGRTLAFTDQGEAADIWLLGVDGDRAPYPWLRTPAIEHQPQFSPDNEWIAYSSNESGSFEVYVQSVTGEAKRAVSTGGGVEPRWSRDGRELFYRSGDSLYAVPVSTDNGFERGRQSFLFEGTYVGDTVGTPAYDVTSDAQRFLMITRAAVDDTQMYLNIIIDWFEELNERVPVP